VGPSEHPVTANPSGFLSARDRCSY
jgi:hypothetical protein